MIRLVLFAFLLNFVSSENQDIVEFTPTLIKNVNDSVELTCKVKNLGSRSISWTKPSSGGNILALNSEATDARYTVRFDKSSAIAFSTLRIANAIADDSGVYRCTLAPTTEGKDITLQVRSPPYIVGNTSVTLNTSLNGSVTLECYGGGYPVPDVTWTRPNNALFPDGKQYHNGSVLKINNVTKNHAGDYYCTVENQVGNSAKKTYRLMVEYAPTVKATHERVGQAKGFEARLECIVDSSDTPTITWIRDNTPITRNDQYYTQTQSAIDGAQTTAVLKVKVEEMKVYGRYTCVAQNRFGKNSVTIDLYHTDKEVCSENCSTNSGHSLINTLELKLSFTSVVILMFNLQNM